MILGGRTTRRGGIRVIRRPENVILPEDRLTVHSIVIQSPGFWEFLGSANVLETIRKYLSDRHDRKKDKEYRSRLEKEKIELENEKLKMEVVNEKITTLRILGIPEEKIRDVVAIHILRPLEQLDHAQDKGII